MDGSGHRTGIDRDWDNLLDYDEIRDLDPLLGGVQNPFDPANADSTGDNGQNTPDGVPDSLNDYDGDGYSNGGEFDGSTELTAYLRANMQEEFVHCMAEKMLTYALGRGLEFYDQCAVDRIMKELSQNEYRFSSLILGVVHSDPFQHQGAKRSNE